MALQMNLGIQTFRGLPARSNARKAVLADWKRCNPACGSSRLEGSSSSKYPPIGGSLSSDKVILLKQSCALFAVVEHHHIEDGKIRHVRLAELAELDRSRLNEG
jgi:hypothetical protein